MGYLQRILFMGLATAALAFSDVPSCTLTIFPQNILIVSGGGSGTISVTVSDPQCSWGALGSNSTWIQQNPPTTGGTGSGSVAFAVAANTNPTPRTGTLTLTLLGSSTVNYQVQIEQ